jgi:hypothetical protein
MTLCRQSTIVRNSWRVRGLSLKQPRSVSGLFTPRIVMQWCVAFMMTPTPWGLRTSSIAGNLRRHFFLNLEALGMGIDHLRELADADDTATRNIGHPRPSDDRRQVMFAIALEADAPQPDHLVIAFDFLEGLLQVQRGILTVACEKKSSNARATRPGISTIPSRSKSSPVQTDDSAEGIFHVSSIWPARRPICRLRRFARPCQFPMYATQIEYRFPEALNEPSEA